jgi:hypothetical protein
MSIPVPPTGSAPTKSTDDSSSKQPFVMTEDMRAKQEARKQAKLAKKAANRAVNGESDTASGATTPGGSQILKRDWKYLNGSKKGDGQTFRLVTWNMLAQTLVRKLLLRSGVSLILTCATTLIQGESYFQDQVRIYILLARRLPAHGTLYRLPSMGRAERYAGARANRV